MTKKSAGLVWLEYIPVRLLFAILGAMPRKMALRVGMSLGRFGYRFAGGLRRVSLRNLEIAFPDKTPVEREAIALASFENLGRILGELTQFPKTSRDVLRELIEYQFDTEESLANPDRQAVEAELDSGRGMLLVGPHLGNWEVGVFAYSAFREPLTYLARPLDNPKIEDFTVALRSRYGNRAIDKNNFTSAGIAILREGGILGIMPDVNVLPRDGVFVPFFGTLACTTSGPALMAMRTNSIIVPMCCVWDKGSERYKVYYGDRAIESPNTGDRHQDVLQMTAEMTAEMEKFVRAYPEQWMWIHKRWKTRPPGEKELY